MSIWAIVLLLMLLLEDFRMVVLNWLGSLDALILIVLFVLVWNWYYRW
ncbi:MAG TPA: hypothetical protein VI874_02355 [Candidatus Norongarragalinales archaeon]|nr:hypothetical protein [Candidatus Norongarragalinales archaeon]